MFFLDASAIIYLIEGDEGLSQATRNVITRLSAGPVEPAFAVSALSLLECRVHPLRHGDEHRLEKFDHFFNDPGLTIIDMSAQVVELATILRAERGLRTPDALQAASCLTLNPETPFITGDKTFRKLPALNAHIIELEVDS